MKQFSVLGSRPSALGSRLSAVLLLSLVVLPLSAQQRPATTPARRTVSLDRTKQPTPNRSPELKVPSWTKTRLSNGAELIVSPKRDLPLVSVNVNLLGGSNQFEDAAKLGVASFT